MEKMSVIILHVWEVVGVEGERRVAGDVHDGGSGLERKYDNTVRLARSWV